MNRSLSHPQRTMLRCSAAGAVKGRGHGVRLTGRANWSTALSLEKLGLGSVSDSERRFHANPAGLAAVTPTKAPA